MNKIIKYLLPSIFAFSILLNFLFLKEILPLLNHYESYWRIRFWIGKNILKRNYINKDKVFNSNKFTINPIEPVLEEPYFQYKNIFNSKNPIEYQDLLRKQLISNFKLNEIQNEQLDFMVDTIIQKENYYIHKVSYQTQNDIYIPAYIMYPKNIPSPWPAVIVSHGCGYGKAGVVGLIEDIHNSIGIDLVLSGFLVFVPDRRGFGELQPVDYFIEPSCGSNKSDGRLLLNKNIENNLKTNKRALDVNDILVAIKYLADREDVKNIGLVGLSGGGIVSSYVAGLSEKLNCLVLSNSFGYLEEIKNDKAEIIKNNKNYFKYPENPREKLEFFKKNTFHSDFSNNIDNMYLTPLALLPKKSLLIQFGENDIISKKTRSELIQYIKDIYSSFKSDSLISITIEKDSGHELKSSSIINFLNKNLK